MRDPWPSPPPAPAPAGVDLHLDLRLGPGQSGRRAALEHALRDAVRTGRLTPGARLPSSRRLATETGLSRGTVKAAYDQLAAEGYLSARQGSATVVAARTGTPAPAPRSPASAPAAPPRHDLRPGRPDVSTFPTAAWLRATRRALATAPASAYDYGDPRGRIELRTALAEYLGRVRGVSADPERIVVTSGSVQGLALLVRVAASVVAMEDPGLPFHREVVRRAGARVVPLPTDAQGARTDLLAGLAEADAVVVTPAHQFPTGATLHPSRRQALTSWARNGGLVIEDDYDGEFRYDRQPVGAVQGMAPDHVVYLGTTSKTLGPALRLGWMVLPPHLVQPVTDAKRHDDVHTGSLGQLALAELIRDHGYDRHVRACRLRYRRRRDLLATRLAGRYAPAGIAAGLHALVALPPGGPDEIDVRRRAARVGLALETLGEFWHEPSPANPRGLIIGYGASREGAYPAALDALAGVLA